MPYEVKLEVFQGPIDLLLHLITRQRVDIYDVSLSQITDEYTTALAAMDELDLDTATGFLVVAATLLELKSLRLLPGRRRDEDDSYVLEERDRLLAKLVESATFREAGAWIAAALEAGSRLHPREVSLEAPFVGLMPDPLARTSALALARAAGLALAPRPEPVLDTSHVAPITASVKDAIAEIAGRLRAVPRLGFRDLCAGLRDRIDVVVRFLALLELFKAGAVELEQADRFGDIAAAWTGEIDARDVVDEVEEYATEGGER